MYLLFTHYVITPWCYLLLFASLFHRPVTQFSLALLYTRQNFGHLMWRADSLEKTLMLGKIDHKRRKGWQRMSWLDSITDSMVMNLSKLPETVKDREGWRAAVHGVTRVRHDLQTELQQHSPRILLPQDLYTHCSLCLWGCSSSYLPADSFTSVSPFIRRHLLNENLSCHSKWTSSPPHTSISISEFSAIPLCFFFFSLSFL